MYPSGEDNFKVFNLRFEDRTSRQQVHGLGQALVQDSGRVGHVREGDGQIVHVSVFVPAQVSYRYYSITINIFFLHRIESFWIIAISFP